MSDSRLPLDQTLMAMAHLMGLRGTCSRRQVGAVFALEGRVLSTGYNGAPAGMPHCEHDTYVWTPGTFIGNWPLWLRRWFEVERAGQEISTLFVDGVVFYHDNGVVTVSTEMVERDRVTCSVAVHAEANAVAFAARHGVRLQGATLHTTVAPCLACAQLLVNVGVERVVAAVPYRDDAGVQLLHSALLRVEISERVREESGSREDAE